jgi:hypothetical protein
MLKGFVRTVSGSSSASNKSEGKEKRAYNTDKEPVQVSTWLDPCSFMPLSSTQAYLRIRPPVRNAASEPSCLTVTSPSSIVLGTPSHSERYHFTKVFEPTVSQSDLFRDTALSLVNDLLQGRSGLLFSYGATNGGKTCTIHLTLLVWTRHLIRWVDTVQGTPQEPGLLPRSIDVIFNSVEQKLSDTWIRPAKVSSVEITPPSERHHAPIHPMHDLHVRMQSLQCGDYVSRAVNRL